MAALQAAMHTSIMEGSETRQAQLVLKTRPAPKKAEGSIPLPSSNFFTTTQVNGVHLLPLTELVNDSNLTSYSKIFMYMIQVVTDSCQ